MALNVELVSPPFQPYSCDGINFITNQSFTLIATAKRQSGALSLGNICMAEGQYRLTLESPLLSSRSPSASTILVDSVSKSEVTASMCVSGCVLNEVVHDLMF